MPRMLQYILFFAATALLQLLFVDNLNLSVYVHPMLCLAFVALLPVELAPIWVLLSGFAMGMVIDVGSGTAGLSSAAMLFSSFSRPLVLRIALAREDVREGGGTPTRELMGSGGFIKYALVFTLLHCAFYFTLEAATWSFYYLTILRIAASTLVTVVLIYVCQLFFVSR